MLWFVSKDPSFYTGNDEDIVGRIRKQMGSGLGDTIDIEGITKLIKLPSKKKAKKAFLKFPENTAIISDQFPSDFGFDDYGIFSAIEVKGKHYPFTTEQIERNFDKDKILSEMMGLKIIKTTKTLANMVGADMLSEHFRRMIEQEELGLARIKGIFLFGVAGAGKSFAAECLAGELKREFVSMDLPHYMSLKSPTRALDDFFDFLLSQKDTKFLLFIDEIEKMFSFGGGEMKSTQVFGKLLTRLNDLFADENSNIMFVATANNVTEIIKRNPEFLRKGRFDQIFFLNYPKIENAVKVFDLYSELWQNRFIERIGKSISRYKEGEDIGRLGAFFSKVEEAEGELTPDSAKKYLVYQENTTGIAQVISEHFSEASITSENLFIYTPPEIAAVVETMATTFFDCALNYFDDTGKIDEPRVVLGGNDHAFIKEVISQITPLQISARAGVSAQIAQAGNYSKRVKNLKAFNEVK